MPGPGIKFYGSQVGGKRVTPHSYTGSPLDLLRHDILSAFSCWRLLPNIVFPLNPCHSKEFCELYPSRANLWAIFLHVILICLQLPFMLSVPLWLLFPGWMVLAGVAVFLLVNSGIWLLLNGTKLRFESNPRYAQMRKEHEHEQWIFLNGVAVGKHWMQSNIDRLALTFGRPVLGVHNKTNGIIFDVLECLIQRNFNYATNDIRDCYKVVKETLYDPNLSKVIFILHSQGGIEGGMILDWLLQEVPQDLLAKLEIYTFGNAANHFNNPHLYLMSQHAALQNPKQATLTRTRTRVEGHNRSTNGVSTPSTSGSFKERQNGDGIDTQAIVKPDHISSPHRHPASSTATPFGKTIHHIEHYAHTHDFVSRWGVLHFLSTSASAVTAPRFMGRVFERQSDDGGHQFCMHYLDNMFPLARCMDGIGVGGSGWDGCIEGEDVKDGSGAFMDEVVEWWGSTASGEAEGLEASSLSASGSFDEREGMEKEREDSDVGIMEMSPVSQSSTFDKLVNGGGLDMTSVRNSSTEKKVSRKFKVKDLSRLWLYRNGRSPRPDVVDAGISRMATM